MVENLLFSLTKIDNLFQEQRKLRLKEMEEISKIKFRKITPLLPSSHSNKKKEIEKKEFNKKQLSFLESENFEEEEGSGEIFLQKLEEENENLLHKYENTIDKTMEIQKKMSEISLIAEQISLHVVKQSEQIEYIHSLVDDASQNIEKGKEHLYQATKRGVDFRIFSLIFILLLSKAILFLHLYNP